MQVRQKAKENLSRDEMQRTTLNPRNTLGKRGEREAGSRRTGKGRMTRKETLLGVIYQAHANGFEFRRWFQANIRSEWPGQEEAVELLTTEGRFYSLVFSHEFARAFWKNGAQMSFVVPSATYSRISSKGEIEVITRKPFTRRTVKTDVWKYHLRQMAAIDDPMRYLKRFMPGHEGIASRRDDSATLSAVS